MNNYTVSINLLALQGTKLAEKNGKQYVVIDLSSARARMHKNGKVYLNLEAIESRQQSDYGDTHFVKESTTKEERLNNVQMPIIGNAKPWQAKGGGEIRKMNYTAKDAIRDDDNGGEIPF